MSCHSCTCTVKDQRVYLVLDSCGWMGAFEADCHSLWVPGFGVAVPEINVSTKQWSLKATDALSLTAYMLGFIHKHTCICSRQTQINIPCCWLTKIHFKLDDICKNVFLLNCSKEYRCRPCHHLNAPLLTNKQQALKGTQSKCLLILLTFPITNSFSLNRTLWEIK